MTRYKLVDIYAAVPDVACKGLCKKACGPVGCSAVEADAMRDNGINPPEVDGSLTCSHLSADGRCRIYVNRPLVCRLFGAVKALACPHGCKPKGGWLSEDRVRNLFATLVEDSGGRPNHFPDLGHFVNALPEPPTAQPGEEKM